MKNRELFQRDISKSQLVNNGQARLDIGNSGQEFDTLREELANFVCEGQYADGMIRILESFLGHLSSASQPAAWVSGFFGSGKSHLLKMLCHLWQNTEFPEQGVKARALVQRMPHEIEAAFKELDTRARQMGGLHAASGTLPAGGTGSVRLAILGILLRSRSLPEAYAQAKFCLFLRNNGFLEKVQSFIAAKKKSFTRELNDLYVSPIIREALIEVCPQLGDAKAIGETLRREYVQPNDISTAEFVRMAQEILKGPNGKLPLTIVVLDEVQLYVGDSSERATLVTEVAESLCKQMDSRIMLVGAGQNALSAQTANFGRLRDRFTIAIELSDQDVETVTRRVLLAKRPDRVDALKKTLESYSGEIDRQLAGTSIASRPSDRDLWVEDYPILPVRRRFWEQALRAVDPTGTSAMLRNQLRIIHDSLRDLAEQPLGAVVAADFIFDQLQPGMVQQGVLLRELDERIRQLDNGSEDGKLAKRLCGLVFLIRRIPREAGSDTGLRATSDFLADLLVSDLSKDGVRLRKEIPRILKKLVDESILLEDHGEYALQTRESSEWEKEYRNRFARIQAKEHEITQVRNTWIRDSIQNAVRGIKVLQGQSKTPRQIAICFGEDPPVASGSDIPVWIRDGWATSEKAVLDAARSAGSDSPTVFVFVPKKSADDLQRAIIQGKAAQDVLDLKGVPTTEAGKEARRAMQTRCEHADRSRNSSVRDLIDSAKVFKGGGQELHNLTLEEKIREAVEAALDRLFPQFRVADHKSWSVVIGRAKAGDDSPLDPLGWTGATADHTVCKEVLREVGAGKDGRAIRKALSESPFGWPQDAIDAALLSLHAGGNLIATLSGATLSGGQLDQAKIPKVEFRTERVALTAQDKIHLRALFQEAGVVVRLSDDLVLKSSELLESVDALANRAQGEAPLPERRKSPLLDELRTLGGNERLGKMLQEREELRRQIRELREASELAAKRLPVWERLGELLHRGVGVSSLDEIRVAARAIEEKRLLLDSADHVAPLVKKAAAGLRGALLAAHGVYEEIYAARMGELEASPNWHRVPNEKRREILAEEGIAQVPTILTGSDEELLAELERTSLDAWKDKTDALPSRFANAAKRAAQLLEPKTQHMHLTSGTLKTEADVRSWVSEQEAKLLAQLKRGPILIA